MWSGPLRLFRRAGRGPRALVWETLSDGTKKKWAYKNQHVVCEWLRFLSCSSDDSDGPQAHHRVLSLGIPAANSGPQKPWQTKCNIVGSEQITASCVCPLVVVVVVVVSFCFFFFRRYVRTTAMPRCLMTAQLPARYKTPCCSGRGTPRLPFFSGLAAGAFRWLPVDLALKRKHRERERDKEKHGLFYSLSVDVMETTFPRRRQL